MPARVHLAGMGAGMVKGIEFLHGQGIHIRAQANGPTAGAIFDDADHPRGSQPAVNGNAPLRQLGGYQIGGAHLLKAQLGVRMDVASQAGDARCLGDDGIKNLHGSSC